MRSVILAVLSGVFTLSAAAQTIIAPGVTLGPESRVANAIDVPANATIDAVVADGDQYLVFWSKPQLGSPYPYSWTTYVRRLNNLGNQIVDDVQVLGPITRPQYGFSASRAADGRFFLAWQTSDGVFVAYVGSDFRIQDSLHVAPAPGGIPRTACNNTTCAAVWGTAGIIINSAGLDVAGLTLHSPAETIAASGNTYAVGVGGLHPDLVFLDANGAQIATEDYGAPLVAVAAGPNNGYVTARGGDGPQVHVTATSATGATVATHDIFLNFVPSEIAITNTNSGPILFLTQQTYPGTIFEGAEPASRIFEVRFTNSLNVVDETPQQINKSDVTDVNLRIASIGTNALLAWSRRFEAVASFYRVITPGNTPSVDEGTAVGTEPATHQIASDIARSDTRVLVTWSEPGLDSTVLRAAVRDIGSNALVAPISLTPVGDVTTGAPRAATDGRDFLVAWTTASAADVVTRVRLINAASAAIASSIDVTGALVSNVVWTGTDYLMLINDRTTTKLVRIGNDASVRSVAMAGPKVGPLVAITMVANRVAILWSSTDVNRAGVYLRIADPVTAAIVSDTQVSANPAVQLDLQQSDGQLLAALVDEQGTLRRYRFRGDGTPLEAGTQLAPRVSTVAAPVILPWPGGWLVTWQVADGSSIAATVSSATGLPGAPFILTDGTMPVSAAAASPTKNAATLAAMKIVPTGVEVVTRELQYQAQPKRRSIRRH